MLDAIAEAETKLNPYTLSGEVERLRSLSSGGASKPSSPLAAVFSPSSGSSVESNRLQFLDQIQSFMVDNYFSAKCNNYQLQDLSLNFTLPKQKYNSKAGEGGHLNRVESVNRLLNKYAALAQQEARLAAGAGGAAGSSLAWTTPAQQMFSPHPTAASRTKTSSNGATSTENSLEKDDFQLGSSSADEAGLRAGLGGDASHRESTDLCLISVPNYIDYFLIDKRSMLTTKVG